MAICKTDFEKVCRMCLLFKINMFSIFTQETATAIKTCIDIEVKKDDEFPKSICFDCLEKIYTYATFREQCKNSQRILHEIVNKDFKTVDSNSKENSYPVCKVENAGTDVESIKKEVVIKEELDLYCEDDKNNVLIGSKTDYDNNNDSSEKEDTNNSKTKDLNSSKQRKHVKKHKCDRCSKTYSEQSVLAKHLTREHKVKPHLKCDVCAKMFVIQAQLNCHRRTHPKSKICDTCGKEVKRNMERHKKSHDRSNKFFCLKCDAMFYQQSYLEIHMKKNHSGTQSLPKKESCPLCNKIVSDVKAHNLKVHAHKSHKCDQCDEAFAFKYLLLDHVRRKHLGIQGNLKALCPTCGKAYPSQGKLKNHLRTHAEDREFGCHLCDKKYKSYNELNFHLKVHAGIRPHVCTHCRKGFHKRMTLIDHIRTHTGERPFACNICGRAFTQKSSLGTHMKGHIKNSTSKT